MMSFNKGLISLRSISPQREFWIGTMFRIFDVHRLDKVQPNENYYDLILTDIQMIRSNSLALVNVTLNSDNKGKIEVIIDDVETGYFIQARILQEYFNEDVQIYLIDDISVVYEDFCKSDRNAQ
ncbi:MAG TPA: hypothetical protein VL098_08365 [Flavipsychrobacter sp.]|nr:hypothetical protein [Flavipsychrobacter sp.]